MRLILLRHADKGIGSDPGLSERGQEQALTLPQALASWMASPALLLGSPKRRTKETLTPLSQAWEASLLISTALDERNSVESLADFNLRLESFFDSELDLYIEQHQATLVVACSHADVLAEVSGMNQFRRSGAPFFSWPTAGFQVYRRADTLNWIWEA